MTSHSSLPCGTYTLEGRHHLTSQVAMIEMTLLGKMEERTEGS